jgi:hypothetical protein
MEEGGLGIEDVEIGGGLFVEMRRGVGDEDGDGWGVVICWWY